jgi:signal transduction histidine kinase
MKLRLNIFCASLILLAAKPVIAQSRIADSLKQKIAEVATDDEKLSAIFKLNEQGLNADSMLPYVIMAERINARNNNRSYAYKSAYIRASYYIRKNLTDSALGITDLLIKEYKNDKTNQLIYLELLFFRAKILDRANQYTQSLTQLYDVVEMARNLKDTLIEIQSKTGIGWVQMEMEQYTEALKWFYDAMYTSSNINFYRNYGALYSNIASAYNSLGKSDSAYHYIDIAIKDARENENLIFLATALSMQAKIYIDSKEPQLAEIPLAEALMIRKRLNDPFYIVYDMSNLASYYANNHQTQKGIELCNEGIALAKKTGLSSQLLMIYHALAQNYKADGNTVEYARTLEYIIALKDSFNNINSTKLLADMQATNETQKNEKMIIEQKLNITTKNYWLYGSGIFAFMAATIAWLTFKNYKRKQALKMQLILEEEKIIATKAITDAEEQERKRIAADLHDNLGAYAASIASNVDNISQQDFDNPGKVALQQLKNNSQSIVSQLNDTIWALKKDALSLTAISDRLKVFIQRIQPSYPNVTVDVLENITTDHLLPPSQAFHLFQIVQEAVNNALKHSGGNHIKVEVDGSDSWVIRISDNGKGLMAETNKKNGGNGLDNMKARAAESGWKIAWLDNKPAGTIAEILPTTN